MLENEKKQGEKAVREKLKFRVPVRGGSLIGGTPGKYSRGWLGVTLGKIHRSDPQSKKLGTGERLWEVRGERELNGQRKESLNGLHRPYLRDLGEKKKRGWGGKEKTALKGCPLDGEKKIRVDTRHSI